MNYNQELQFSGLEIKIIFNQMIEYVKLLDVY